MPKPVKRTLRRSARIRAMNLSRENELKASRGVSYEVSLDMVEELTVTALVEERPQAIIRKPVPVVTLNVSLKVAIARIWLAGTIVIVILAVAIR